MGKRNQLFQKTVLIFLCLGSIFCVGCKNEKAVYVAFCNVPEKVQNGIKKEFEENYSYKFKYEQTVVKDKKSAKKAAEKYDLIFSWNGNVPRLLEAYAQNDDAKLNDLYPESIRKCSYALPILIDHYGISYSVSLKSKLKYRYPGSIVDFERVFKKLVGKVDYPLFVAGKDDAYLLAFIGCFCESYGGRSGYEAFLTALDNYSTLESFLATSISDSETIDSIFNHIFDWEQKKILTRGWQNASIMDFKVLSKDEKVASAFISLGEFHNLNYEIAKDFVCDRFPVKNQQLAHSLVAPVIVCVNVSQKNNAKKIYEDLALPESQSYLSKQTALAPAAKLGQAFDKQADDVRFLAAACLGGPVADAEKAIFEFNSDKMSVICDDLRAYLKN